MENENRVGALISELIEKFDVLDGAVKKLVSAFDRLEGRVNKLEKVDGLKQHLSPTKPIVSETGRIN